MPIARITGTSVSVNNEEVVGASPNGVNGYFNEYSVFVKRPGLEFLSDYVLDINSGISGIYHWVDQNQVVVTQYNGSIWRINASGVTELSSSSVRCGTLKSVIDGNGVKLWIASGGRMINIEAMTPAGGAYYCPAYSLIYNAINYPTKQPSLPYMSGPTPPPDNVTHVAITDGYVICSNNTGQMFYNDGPALSANDSLYDLWTLHQSVNAEYKPDNLLALGVWFHEIFMFGPRSIEVYYNDGYSPFSKVEGSQLDVGLISPYAIVTAGNIPYLMLSDRTICAYNGRVTKVISDPIQSVLDNMTVANDIAMSVLIEDGQTFILCSFPTADQSWAYNLKTGTWTEWKNSAGTGAIDIGIAGYILDTSFNATSRLSSSSWAGIVASEAATSGQSWTNPTNAVGAPNIFGSQTSAASYTATTFNKSDSLVSTSFASITVPVGSTVTGVEVQVFVLRDRTFGANVPGSLTLGSVGLNGANTSASMVTLADYDVSLTGTALVSGATNTLAGTIGLGAGAQAFTYGGPSDTWGLDFTSTDFTTAVGFKWRSAASAVGSFTVNVLATKMTVYYSTANSFSSTSATWAGDPAKGRLYKFNHAQYSDELASGTEAIEVTLETPVLEYTTLRKKLCDRLMVRTRSDSHSMNLYINSDNKGYGPGLSIPINTGRWFKRSLGIFTSRQYKFRHKRDCAFSFIELEENVKVLK